MKKSNVMLFVIAIISLCSFIDVNHPIIGKWEVKDTFNNETFHFIMNFRKDGTFDAFLNKKPFTSGKFRTKGDTILLMDPVCNVTYYGTYKLNFGNDKIAFPFTY